MQTRFYYDNIHKHIFGQYTVNRNWIFFGEKDS